MWANTRSWFCNTQGESRSIPAPPPATTEPCARPLFPRKEPQCARPAFPGLTWAVGARSQLPAAGAGPPAARHRCPPRNCGGARREPPPPGSTPSAAAARWTACGNTHIRAGCRPRYTPTGQGCGGADTCDSGSMHTEKGARRTKERERKENQLGNFQIGLDQDVSSCRQGRTMWRGRFMSRAHPWGSARSVHPTAALLPSFTQGNPKKRAGGWHRTCPALADTLACVCSRLFAIGTGEQTRAGRGGAPTLRCQGWRGNAPGCSSISCRCSGHLVLGESEGTLWPMWRLAVSKVRNEKPDCLVSLSAVPNCYYRLFCQPHKNIHNCPQKWTLGFWATKSGHCQRHGPAPRHVPGRAAQAVDEACSARFAPSMLSIIWESRERCQAVSKNHSFKSCFEGKLIK